VAAYTILPVFLSTLTDSPILIGLIPAMEGAGWFLPQLFLAKHIEGQNRRLPLVLKLSFLDRLPFLLLALVAFFIQDLNPNVAVLLFFIVYGVKVLSSGLVALPWQELIATVIPTSHRGRYWGSALISGKLLGMVGAFISGLVLTRVIYPRNYAFMFLIGFFCSAISFIFLSRNIEPEIDRQIPQENINLGKRIGSILQVDKNFFTFLVNRGLIFVGFMGMGFVTVYGIQKYALPVSYSALFTAIMMVSEIFGFGIWGILGDKNGYKQVLEISSLLLILGILSILLINSVGGVYIAFGIISLAHSGEYLADQNIAMEFGDEANRPTYIGMSKTLTGPFMLVAPIVAGTIVKTWGYQSMFLTAMVIAALGFVTIKFFVTDPRKLT